MTRETATTSPSGRYAGLDGLRAIAVSLVVAYHLFPGWWLPQGFIGVEVFFVISGFLITSLLLSEAAASQAAGRGRRISLVEFWRRRARRLLPALATLIVVCGLWAWTVGGDVLVGFGRQVLGALTFSFNWISISAGSGYFDAGTPELFRNLWSLAVEEQFYVLWPLLFPLLLLIPSRLVRAGVALVAAAGSAAWMAFLVAAATTGGAGDVTRAYFGTDSHGFGILLGVALAFVAGRALQAPPSWMLRASVRRVVTAGGMLAVAGIVAVAAIPPAPDTATFPGALLVACLLTVLAIAAGAWPASVLGRALNIAPVRWVGVRSYGIYLWHWPVVVLLMAGLSVAPGTEVPLAVGLGALAITLVAATVSYRVIETPVRRHGFRASLAILRARLSGAPAGRFVALGAVTAFVLAAGATTSAIASAPQTTSGAAAVEAGQQALEAGEAERSTSPEPSPSPTGPRVEPPLAVQTGDEPVPGPRPTPVTGDQVSAIGDSVMLASAPGLMERLPGIQIDASVSRSMNAGVAIAEAQAAAGQLRPYVVVALGTNGPISPEALARLDQAVGPDRHLILVNAFAPRDWINGVNAELATFDAAQPGVVIADWAGAVGAHQDLLAGDHIHPGPTGGRLFAETVATTVQGVENARAQAAFDKSMRASALASRLVDG